MANETEELCRAAAKLAPAERLELVHRIMESLDTPDDRLNALWANEADHRFAAYKRGEIEAFDESEVFGNSGRA